MQNTAFYVPQLKQLSWEFEMQIVRKAAIVWKDGTRLTHWTPAWRWFVNQSEPFQCSFVHSVFREMRERTAVIAVAKLNLLQNQERRMMVHNKHQLLDFFTGRGEPRSVPYHLNTRVFKWPSQKNRTRSCHVQHAPADLTYARPGESELIKIKQPYS